MAFPSFSNLPANSRPSTAELDRAFSVGVPHVALEAFRDLNVFVGGEERWDNAFAAAQALAIATKLPIWLGGGGIKYFSGALNCSANDTSKDGLTLIGAGARWTKLVFRHTTGAAIEMQGVDHFGLRGLQVSGSMPIGIAGGRATVRQWCGRQRWHDVAVIMTDDMTANGGIGTIALLGIEPEESAWDFCEFWANLPVILCPPNNITVPTLNTDGTTGSKRTFSYTPAFTPILTTIMSNTVYRFTGGCRMVAWQPDAPVVALISASSIDLGDSFLQTRGGGANASSLTKKCPYAVYAENVWGYRHFGTYERAVDDNHTDLGYAILSGTLINWDVVCNGATASGVSPGQVPILYCIDFTGGVWRGLDMRIRAHSNQAQVPFRWPASTAQINVSNCTFKLHTTASLSTIPQQLLFNASNLLIELIGANSTVPVTLHKPSRYRGKLLAAKDIAYNTATTIATVVLPSSGLSTGTILLRNVVMMAGFVTGLANSATLTGQATVTWTRHADTTGLTVTVTQSTWDASCATAPSSLDIAAPTISATLNGQAGFTLTVLPTLTGTGSSGVATRFEAEVTYVASYGTGNTTAVITTQ